MFAELQKQLFHHGVKQKRDVAQTDIFKLVFLKKK
jgi:hypothetical protein